MSIYSILLERGAKLLLSGGGYSGAEVLFTLGTFYDTFVNTSPACIARGANTTNLIRASLCKCRLFTNWFYFDILLASFILGLK